MHFLNRINRIVLLCLLVAGLAACGKDDAGQRITADTTIPENDSWQINTILDLGGVPQVSPKIKFHHENDRLHMAWYQAETPEGESAPEYSIMYKSFLVRDLLYLSETNTRLETVTRLHESGRSLDGLDISVAGDTPIVAYSLYKELIHVEGADLNNQGDVMLGIRNGDTDWQSEIFAFGYVSPDRNPVFTDGLAKENLSLQGDSEGNAELCFQFFYEGIDSYNYAYPDLRFIRQPLNNIAETVGAAAPLEETIEGNNYTNNAGHQYYQGGHCDLILDSDGNQAAFHYIDATVAGSSNDYGLRVSRRIEGDWQATEWVDQGVEVIAISGAAKPDGLLAVTYTVKDAPEIFVNEEDENNPFVVETVPFSIRYSEQVEILPEEGNDEDEIRIEWRTETINFTSIAGEYCSLAIDSSGNPVIAFYDDMNYTQNRFFSRIKIAKRDSNGLWNITVIAPEDVGLTIQTSPYDVSPGMHDKYYIGKYNYLWLDTSDRVHLCTYSGVSGKVWLFRELVQN